MGTEYSYLAYWNLRDGGNYKVSSETIPIFYT